MKNANIFVDVDLTLVDATGNRQRAFTQTEVIS
jgi:hypothetical protein